VTPTLDWPTTWSVGHTCWRPAVQRVNAPQSFDTNGRGASGTASGLLHRPGLAMESTQPRTLHLHSTMAEIRASAPALCMSRGNGVTRRTREGAAGLVSNLYSRPSSTLCIHLRPFSDLLHEAVLTCFYTFAPTSSTAVDLPAFRFAHWLLAIFFARVCVLHRAYNHSAHLCIKYGEPRSQT